MASTEGQSAALVAEFARHLVAAAGGPGGDTGQSHDGSSTEIALRARGEVSPTTPRGDARIRAGAERAKRIEAGRRARRLPYLATAATAASGYTAWGIGELAAAGAGPLGTLVTTSSTAGLCGVALGILRATYRNQIPERWLRRWWTAGAGAAGWVTSASAIGAGSWPMSAALALGAVAASTKWLREHEVPQPRTASVTPGAPAEIDQDLGELLARRWADNVATKVVPGSLLTDREDLPRAIRWTIQTIPGSMSFETIYALRRRIAGGLRTAAAKMLLEPSDVDESAVTLTVITKDILADGIPYTGPRYENGRIALGPYADGAGESEYIAYDQVGCRNGMATGEPGSGKSAFLEAVAMGLKSSGEWVVLFGDGDPEGGSSPLLNELSDWAAAGPEQILAQLEAIEAALPVRGMLKATLTAGPDGRPVPITDPSTQRPIRELRPSPVIPAIKWIIDELHRLSSDPWLIERKFIPRLERIVRIGRKYGIVVLTGSQSLLAPDYGNSTPLRGYLAARNLFAFRNGNKSEKAVVSGLEISPGVLPAGGGYAFAAGGGRLAMTRVAWAPDMGRFAVGLPTTALDQDTDLAIAPFRPATQADPASAFAAQAAKLAAWRSQQDLGAAPTPGSGQAIAPATGQQMPLILGGLAGLAVPAALTADNVIPIRRLAPKEETSPDLDALPNTQRAVYDALQSATDDNDDQGKWRTGQIAVATGLKLPAVSKALKALEDLGLAVRLAHGEWAPAPDPAQTG